MKDISFLTILAVAPFLAVGCSCNCNVETPAEAGVPAETVPATAPADKKAVPALIDTAAHPFLVKTPFVAWSQLTYDKIVPDTKLILEITQAKIDAICELKPEELSYDSVVGAYDSAFFDLGYFEGILSHCESTCMTDGFREQYEIVQPMLSEFWTAQSLNEKYYAVLKAYSETPEAKGLDPIRARHLKQMLEGFVDGGVDLPADKKEELKAVMAEMVPLTQKFSQNVLDANNSYKKLVTDEAKIAGLPESNRKEALAAAIAAGLATEEKPAWLFTTQVSSYSPAMKYLDDEELRREIFLARNNICAPGTPYDNTDLMKRILALRQREAEILGYKNFTDLILKRRMAKNGETAMAFVDDLAAKTKPAFDREYNELRAFRSSVDPAFKLSSRPSFQPWDFAYWAEKYRRAEYDFDENLLKPYFESNNVVNGMFAFFDELYDLTIREIPSAYRPLGSTEPLPEGMVEIWHPTVKCYEIIDNKLGYRIGVFYMDMFPRKEKRSGAWMHPFVAGNHDKGEVSFAMVCGNLTALTGNGPALWSHYDVETLYHEFGHNLHQILGNVPVSPLNGSNVAWDFVELPSQINENWTWEPAILARWAKHYQTNEPIPQAYVDAMVRARNFQAAYQQMRQLSFAKGDLYIHMNAKDLAGQDIDKVARDVTKDYVWPSPYEQRSNMNSFTHLFRDPVAYASGYYSYKWAEALQADAFQTFKRPDGSLDLSRGMVFRRTILEKGDSKDASELFRDFVGRDPDWNAINVLHGIVPAK
ncbi:MAG: M3 family metallopeptidase [Opitutales bacterium]|nr:M3 family metallopeptidase [Opitutales bacterium]